jgi:pyridoxamine 5'-phosphate oxidase
LRTADAATGTFVFHADARSDKIREISEDPRVSVVFFDPQDGIEARFTGRAALHRGDDVAHAACRPSGVLRRASPIRPARVCPHPRASTPCPLPGRATRTSR